MVTAALSCLLTGGLAFGFSALIPSLQDAGVFQEDCRDTAPCRAQHMHMIWIFTAGTAASALSTWPQGILMDWLGPRICGVVFNTAVAVGCALFSMGGSGPWQLTYTAGFTLLAVGGSGVFVSTVTFGNLLPEHAGFLTAILVCCFDASTVMFQAFAFSVSLGAKIPILFQVYALLSATLAAAAGLFWPAAPVAGPRKQHASTGGYDVWSKILRLDFALFAYSVVVNVVCLNFFLVSVYPRMRSVAPENARMLNSSFAVLLPAGPGPSGEALGLH